MNTRELAQILLNIPSVGGARTKKIIEHYDGGNLPELISRLYPFLHVDDETIEKAEIQALNQIKRAEEAGISLHSWKDSSYPSGLLSICDYPPLIYTRGDSALTFQSPSAALIGSRKADSRTLEITEEIGKMLVSHSYSIVSGLALGCDTAAHRSAIISGGSTIAVLPGGPDYIYPRENHTLYHQMIAGRGLILSEYAPATPPAPYRFVRRDRLQSGLSRFIVLMQSPVSGGSMHTVAAAVNQKRPLFVYCGNTDDHLSGGNRYLIESRQGIPFGTTEELSALIPRNTRIYSDCQSSADQILFSYD